MTGAPIDLATARERRSQPAAGSNLACRTCGSQWWSTSVVVDATSMRVTGYAAELTCTECGRGPTKVDQTILAGDPKRLGNCVSACVASYLGLDLEQVPHFVERDPDATVDGSAPSAIWWWLLVGFMAGNGLWPVDLGDVDDARPGEIVFVGGPSRRGVLHQVLYRDGQLWHDPHPSRAGVIEVTEITAWRPRAHDHSPTGSDQ